MDLEPYRKWASGVIARGELYIEIERVRQLLVLAEQRPCSKRADQIAHVKNLSYMFKALILAKDARQKVVQDVRQDNGSSSQNGSTSPTDDAGACVGIRYILQ
jgi:hypothetical protein